MKKLLKNYLVHWCVDGGGQYVYSGYMDDDSGYRADLHGADIIAETSKERAEAMVQKAHPNAYLTEKTIILGDIGYVDDRLKG